MARVRLKRLLAPKFWGLEKKQAYWAISPKPGPHKKSECIPLGVIVRDLLGLAETLKEAKKIIKKGEILIDGKPRKDHAFPVGLFDVISIPKIKKHFRIVPFKKGLKLVEIDEEESKLKICRIENKTAVRKGKFQLNLHDGKNLLVEDEGFKTGDSLLLELPKLKIFKHLPLEPAAIGVAIKGKNAGKMVKILEIKEGKFKQPPKIIGECEGRKVEILKKYVFVVGKEKPEVRVIG